MDLTTEVLEIIIRARDEASAQFDHLANSVDGAAAHINGVRAGFAAMGAGAALAIAASIKAAADFQDMTQKVQNNTTMTARDLATMRAGILRLASEGNTPLKELSDGFMHISNLGFSSAQATDILRQAMRSASSTGGDTAKVAETLALQLHEFGLKAGDAARVMDTLHFAAALGNSTLEQFVGTTSKAVATAANLGVPLRDVDAALAALSRHMPLAEASTALAGAMDKIVNPSKSAAKELALLSEKTGIDLVHDFTQAGLHAKGLYGVLDDLRRATGGNVTELFKLLPALRGGRAAMILTGTGAADYREILAKLGLTMSGTLTPTADAWARSQQTLAFQTGKLANNIHVAAINIGTAFLPVVTAALQAVVPLVQRFAEWTGHNAKLAATILSVVAVGGLLLGGLTGLGVVMTLVVPGAGLLAGAIGAIAAPVLLVAAAAGALYLAWRDDWGGIREATAAAWAAMQPAIAAVEASIRRVEAAYAAGGLGRAAGVAWAEVRALTARAAGWLGSTGLPLLRAQLDRYETALWNWVKVATPIALRELGALTGRLAGWLGGTGLPALAKALEAWETAAWNWIKAAAPPAIRELGVLVGKLASWLATSGLPRLRAQLDIWETALWNWVRAAVPPMVRELGALTGRLAGWLAAQLPAWARQLDAWETALWNWITMAAPAALAAIGSFVDGLVNWIGTKGEAELRAELADMGHAAVQGFKDGISSMAGGARDHVTGFFGGMVDAGKKALRSRSPSKVFEEIGVGVVQGFNLGIEGTAVRHLPVQPLIDAARGQMPQFVALGRGIGEAIVRGIMEGMVKLRPALAALAIAGSVAAGGGGASAGGAAGAPAASSASAYNAAFDKVTARGIAFADMLAEHLHRLHAIAVADLFDQAKAARDMAAENRRYAVERGAYLAAEAGQRAAAAAARANEHRAAQQAHLQGEAAGRAAAAQTFAAYVAGLRGMDRARAQGHVDELRYLADVAAARARDFGNDARLQADLGRLEGARYVQQLRDARAVGDAEHEVSRARIQAAGTLRALARSAAEDQTRATLGGIADARVAALSAFAAWVRGLHGVDLARGQQALHEREYLAQVALLKAADYRNALQYGRDLALLDTEHAKGRILDSNALAAAHKAEHAARTAALDAARKRHLEAIAAADQAAARSFAAQLGAVQGLDRAHADAKLHQLQYLADLATIRARDYKDATREANDLAALRARHAGTQLADARAVAAIHAAAHAEHLRQIAAQREARRAQHLEHLEQLATERRIKREAHLEHLADVAQTRATYKAMHDAIRAQAREIAANARIAARAAAAEARTQARIDRSAPGTADIGGLVGQGYGGPAYTPATSLPQEQQQLYDTLRNTADALPDVVKQLARATDLTQLQDAYDTQHLANLRAENDARMQGNRALLSEIEGQDRGLRNDYQRERSLQRQVDTTRRLKEVADRNLETARKHLETLQAQAQSAHDAVATAREALDNAQQTVQQRRELAGIAEPYNARHRAQVEQIAGLQRAHAAQLLGLEDRLREAREQHNAALIAQLDDQKQQYNDAFQGQVDNLQAIMQADTDVFDQQRQHIQDEQQARNDARTLDVARDALATAQKKAAATDAAVAVAKAQVGRAQEAANKAADAWNRAIAGKDAADGAAYDAAIGRQQRLRDFIQESYNRQIAQLNDLAARQAGQPAGGGAAGGAGTAGTAASGPPGQESAQAQSLSQRVFAAMARPDPQQQALIKAYGKTVAAGIIAGMMRGMDFQTAYIQSVGPEHLPTNADGTVRLPTMPTPAWGSPISTAPTMAAPPAATQAPALAGAMAAGAPGPQAIGQGQAQAPAGGVGQTVNITVTVASGAVEVNGNADSEVAKVIAAALSEHALILVQSQRNTLPGSGQTAPGAR